MSLIYRRASKLPNYLRAFGPFRGLHLLTRIERTLPQRSSVIESYTWPGRTAPIYLRQTVSDHATFWQCIVRRQYDFKHFPQSDRVLSTYRDQVKNGISPLIIDCGGNVGLAARYFADQFPDARLISIEPQSDNFTMLERNVACLGDRITALNGGIWNETGTLQITNPGAGSAAFRVDAASGGTAESIRAYTIAEVCALAKVDAPLIVKIDIEGAQRTLFSSNTDWVARTHLIMLELDDWLMPWQGTSRPFFSCLSKYPFDYIISGETMFCFRDTEADAAPC